MSKVHVDIAIVGGGIVGLATGYRLSQVLSGCKIAILEKESTVGFHQSGRNSGVIHSGIYYQPGSLKAQTCLEGKKELEAFCSAHGIAWDPCGKVIVAVDEEEVPSLEKILERGKANGVPCEKIDPKQLSEIEPHAHGVAAIHVPSTGIVDYPGVCSKLAELLIDAGHQVLLRSKVHKVDFNQGWGTIQTSDQPVVARLLINCGGLHCDRIMKLCGAKQVAKIVPFRGEYFELSKGAEYLCRNLIYPVPNPNFPFLGVHFTRMIHGGVECGPNAVLAMAREGYDWKTWNLGDLAESLSYPGFLKLAARYWRMGAEEMVRSLSKSAFVRALQRLVPGIQSQHLRPAPAGVRAQAIAPDGKMIDDFLFVDQEQAIHVCNAPSPAATASLRIGSAIAQRAVRQMQALT